MANKIFAVIPIVLLLLFFSIEPGRAQSSITTVVDEVESCTYRWFCSNWNPEQCPENGIQKRACTNAGNCPDDYKKPEEKRECTAAMPKELFDIKLELEKYEFDTSDDLVAWVRFENFGSIPTPVNLTYIAYDNDNNPFYIKHDTATVETERFVVQRFPGLRLKPGKYTLVLHTVYAENVKDEFRQDFKVKHEDFVWVFAILGVVAALLLLIIYLNNKT